MDYQRLPSFFIGFMISAIFLNILALKRLYQHFYVEKRIVTLTVFILANLVYWPTFMNTTFGQVALLLNAIVIFCYLALEKKQFIRAGFLLALATNIKLFFGIFFIYFLARKQYGVLFSLISLSMSA